MGGSVPEADPTPVPGVMTDARNGFAALRPTPKPVAYRCSPTPIEESPPDVVSPLIPVLAVGGPIICPGMPTLPSKAAHVLSPVGGNDTTRRPEPGPPGPLIPDHPPA